jgi:hypothetical protein
MKSGKPAKSRQVLVERVRRVPADHIPEQVDVVEERVQAALEALPPETRDTKIHSWRAQTEELCKHTLNLCMTCRRADPERVDDLHDFLASLVVLADLCEINGSITKALHAVKMAQSNKEGFAMFNLRVMQKEVEYAADLAMHLFGLLQHSRLYVDGDYAANGVIPDSKTSVKEVVDAMERCRRICRNHHKSIESLKCNAELEDSVLKVFASLNAKPWATR